MRKRGIAQVLVGAVCAALLGTTPQADSASSLVLGTSPPGAVDQCGGSGFNATILPQVLGPTSPQYVATFDGVATSMSYSAASAPAGAQVRALFVRPVGGGTYTVAAKSPLFPMVAGKVTSYPIRVSVHPGDYLALNFKGGGADDLVSCWFSNTGSTFVTSSSDVDSTSTLVPTFQNDPGLPDISAVIEPDADGDGYGDVSQDQCPGSAQDHGPCVDRIAPDTAITKAPPRKTTKHRIRFGFSSPDSTATFQCALDSKTVFKPCASPDKLKVKTGKHTLLVRAVDAAGNVDATPAEASWRVRPKRPEGHH